VSVWKGGERKLTNLNDNLLGAKTLASVQPLAVTAADGRKIDAWLVTPSTPAPGGKYPLILEIHGGPFSAYGPHFSTDDQLYAAAGEAAMPAISASAAAVLPASSVISRRKPRRSRPSWV
jgi:dipeptidyl aminopeptidase/acylaminoacyl peptidase